MIEFLFLGFFVEFPIYDRQVDRANPHTDFASNTLVKFKVNPSPEALRKNQLFVRILNGDRATAHVVKGHRQALTDILACLDRLFRVITDLFEKFHHDGCSPVRED
nr:hypothetical 12.2K protein - Plectonema boryanum [Leptolyngbya boryana]